MVMFVLILVDDEQIMCRYSFVCWGVCLFVCLLVRVFVCLFVCLFVCFQGSSLMHLLANCLSHTTTFK